MRNLAILCIICILSACQNIRYPEKPEDLLSEEKMADILTDVYLFNAAKSSYRGGLQKSGLQPEPFLFEKHQIDSLQFERSNTYYSAHTKTLTRIYNRVEEKLQRQKQQLDSLPELQETTESPIEKQIDSIELIKK